MQISIKTARENKKVSNADGINREKQNSSKIFYQKKFFSAKAKQTTVNALDKSQLDAFAVQTIPTCIFCEFCIATSSAMLKA